MNDWCKEHHNKSGLVQRVRDSTISLQEAEQQVRGMMSMHGARGGSVHCVQLQAHPAHNTT
jgi:oligoribonuclease